MDRTEKPDQINSKEGNRLPSVTVLLRKLRKSRLEVSESSSFHVHVPQSRTPLRKRSREFLPPRFPHPVPRADLLPVGRPGDRGRPGIGAGSCQAPSARPAARRRAPRSRGTRSAGEDKPTAPTFITLFLWNHPTHPMPTQVWGPSMNSFWMQGWVQK